MNRYQRRRMAQRQRTSTATQPEAWGYAEREKSIAWQIVRELRRLSYHVSSTQQTRASRQTEGMPDLFVAHPAWKIYAWLEVKRPGEKPSVTQRAWHEIVREAGCPVLVVTSVVDAVQQLNELRVE